MPHHTLRHRQTGTEDTSLQLLLLHAFTPNQLMRPSLHALLTTCTWLTHFMNVCCLLVHILENTDSDAANFTLLREPLYYYLNSAAASVARTRKRGKARERGTYRPHTSSTAAKGEPSQAAQQRTVQPQLCIHREKRRCSCVTLTRGNHLYPRQQLHCQSPPPQTAAGQPPVTNANLQRPGRAERIKRTQSLFRQPLPCASAPAQ